MNCYLHLFQPPPNSLNAQLHLHLHFSLHQKDHCKELRSSPCIHSPIRKSITKIIPWALLSSSFHNSSMIEESPCTFNSPLPQCNTFFIINLQLHPHL
ncbi:unnamed protein product [Vicia faba]|uniref:Uncharacterized protein n=1 Tax=Vicia faba TaxID=3906 RepID=A0AAV0ZMC8_VICFA|nr:unnamed protein product [Vicia faba]